MQSTKPRAGTVREWIGRVERRFKAARLFFGHGTGNARDEAAWLVVHALGMGFDEIDTQGERPVSPLRAARIERLAESRVGTQKPLAYLLHEAWLTGERFYVDERVIVPRSFIAELLPDAISPWLGSRGPRRILDLCTGSGCLAILAAKGFPRARVDASDISPAALSVARRNVREHRVRSRVKTIRSDLFESLGGPYDLILSNPPYVDARAMSRLPAEYRREPLLALAGGADGLDLAMKILERAPQFLSPRGVLVMEIGHNRRTLEKRRPRRPLTWMSTSAGDDMVLLARHEDLLR